MTGTFVVRYWQNLDAQLIGCEQTMAWEGTIETGFGVMEDCTVCSGQIVIDPMSVADVSDPAINPDDCSAELLATRASENWGTLFTGEDGGGAWLDIPLLDLATATQLLPSPTNGGTLQETVDGLSGNGLQLTHVGFVPTGPGSIFGADGFDLPGVGANPPEPGAPYGSFWTVFIDPTANTNAQGVDLNGDYFLGSFWLLQ